MIPYSYEPLTNNQEAIERAKSNIEENILLVYDQILVAQFVGESISNLDGDIKGLNPGAPTLA